MLTFQISHEFNPADRYCPTTMVVGVRYIERAIRLNSDLTFTCSMPGCHHKAPARSMYNIALDETNRVVVVLCPLHASGQEDLGHRCYHLNRTLERLVYRVRLNVSAAVSHVLHVRPTTDIGRALQQACCQQVGKVA